MRDGVPLPPIHEERPKDDNVDGRYEPRAPPGGARWADDGDGVNPVTVPALGEDPRRSKIWLL